MTVTISRGLDDDERRQAIEPVICHLKSDGHLGRNWLRGMEGDRMNVLLCGAGHNLRLILRWLRFLSLDFGGLEATFATF